MLLLLYSDGSGGVEVKRYQRCWSTPMQEDIGIVYVAARTTTPTTTGSNQNTAMWDINPHPLLISVLQELENGKSVGPSLFPDESKY